jgi:hypothetical protein
MKTTQQQRTRNANRKHSRSRIPHLASRGVFVRRLLHSYGSILA